MSKFPSQSDLAKYDEAQPNTDDALMYQLDRHRFSPAAVAAGLGVSTELADYLMASGGAQYLTLRDRPAYMPVEAFPAATARAVVAFRKLVSWMGSNAPTTEAPSLDADVKLPDGAENIDLAAWLRSGANGLAGFVPQNLPNPRQRVQLLTTYGLTTATLAKACATSVENIDDWLLADVRSLPFDADTKFHLFLQVLKFLSTGPTLGTAGTHKPRSQRTPERIF